MRLLIFAYLSIGLSLHALAHAQEASAGDVKVAAAAVELQATDNMIVAGDIVPTTSSGQDGKLRAVATVIQGPPHDTRVAIVALDIVAIGRDVLDPAAREIEAKTGIAFDHILINSTHNHRAPTTVKVHSYNPDPVFVGEVRRAIVEAVVEANAKLASSPALRMRFMMGKESTVGENSRFELRNGTISWFFQHPEAERLGPTGPFDPDFPVMAFERPDRTFAAVIFGHSTHNIDTPHPERRSPGFYGLAAQAYEKESGAVTTFIEGAAGSTHLMQIDGLKAVDPATASQVALEAERRILDAVRYHVDQAPAMPVERIGALKHEIAVKVRRFDEAKEEKAVSSYCKGMLGEKTGEKIAAVFRQMRAELAPHQGEERKSWVSVMRIGDVAIVGVPAELFTQLGLDIKRRSPFRYTFIAELANDWAGYVGNADAYRLGGYQMWMGLHSWTERGTGELIVNESVKLLNELYLQ